MSPVAPCEGSVDWNPSKVFFDINQASRSLWGERGLKPEYRQHLLKCLQRRSLWGEHGLKFMLGTGLQVSGASLPVRGAWIEMRECAIEMILNECRSLWGERGLKCRPVLQSFHRTRVAPCEGSVDWNLIGYTPKRSIFVSLPVRGAWIEIGRSNHDHRYSGSLPVRGAWIEVVRWLMLLPVLDRSQRGKCGLEGWSQLGDRRESGVIPREGSVGWNIANNIEGIAWLCFVLCEENTFVSTTSGQSRNYYIFEIAKNTKKLSLFTT